MHSDLSVVVKLIIIKSTDVVLQAAKEIYSWKVKNERYRFTDR